MEVQPITCKFAYQWAKATYFPNAGIYIYGVSKFVKLARLLEVEKIRPDRYIMFIFSTWDVKGRDGKSLYPTPKQLTDPVLVKKYRDMSSE